jgi:hypothetical protein
MQKMQPNPASRQPDQRTASAFVEPARQSAQVIYLDRRSYIHQNVRANNHSSTYSAGSALPAGAQKTSGGHMADLTREELDAKLTTVSAQTDTKLARLEGKLDLVITELRSVNDTYKNVRDGQRATIANLWVVFAALAAIIIGSIAAAPVIFDLGMKLRETITKEVQERTPPPPPLPPAPPVNRPSNR